MQHDKPPLTLGARIRALRRARGLTQDRLANSTGVSRSAVAQWESDRAGHSTGMLRRLADVLGVSVSTLNDGWDTAAMDTVLSSHELALIHLYRSCNEEDRAVLMQVASKIAASTRID